MSLRRTVVLNLGGEGEPHAGDLVVNVNLMHPPLLMRPSFPTRLGFGQVVIAASAGVLPVRDSVVTDFRCSSCDVRQLTSAFTGAGLALVEASRPGYPLRLRKAEAS